MKPLSAGSEIDAWCTRCRLDLGHRIVAMVDSRPKRVVCLTCGSQHNYRAPRSQEQRAPRPSRPPRARRETPSQRVSAEQERVRQWEAQVLGKAASDFARYALDRTFRAGELIVHDRFGEGYVTAVLEDGKVGVMFRDGPRTLAHSRG